MPLIPRIVCCLRSKCYSDECLPSKVIVDCSTGYATTSSTAYSRVNAQHIKDRNQIRSHFSRRACKPRDKGDIPDCLLSTLIVLTNHQVCPLYTPFIPCRESLQ